MVNSCKLNIEPSPDYHKWAVNIITKWQVYSNGLATSHVSHFPSQFKTCLQVAELNEAVALRDRKWDSLAKASEGGQTIPLVSPNGMKK